MKIRNWLRLSLRELFLLVALAATGLGWYLDHQRVRDLHELMDFIDATRTTMPPSDIGSVTTLERWENRGHAYKFQLTEISMQENPTFPKP